VPRGSKPGERRGGRKKGTPNKKTAWKNLFASRFANSPHLEPVDLFLHVMRARELPLDNRIEAAKQALPYLHSKRRPITLAPQSKAKDSRPRVKLRAKTEDTELDGDWLGLDVADAASMPFNPSMGTGIPHEAANLRANDKVESAELARRRELASPPLCLDDPTIVPAETTALPGAAGATAHDNLSPMTFLREVSATLGHRSNSA
jgi:hypothetical protein